MAVKVKTVKRKKVTIIPEGVSIVDTWLLDQVREEISDSIIEENRKQAGLVPPNLVTRIVVDRRNETDVSSAEALSLAGADNITFVGLDKRITFYYTETALLAEAFIATWHKLESLTAVGKTKDAYKSYEFFAKNYGTGQSIRVQDPEPIVRFLKQNEGSTINVHIIGPRIEYRRAVIYHRRGQKAKWVPASKSATGAGKNAVDRWKYLDPKSRNINRKFKSSGKSSLIARLTTSKRGKVSASVLVARAIQEVTVASVKRQFKDIWFSYGFATDQKQPLPIKNHQPRNKPWKPSGANENVPVIRMGPKFAGRHTSPKGKLGG